MFRALFAMLSPAGPGARLSVLIFHRVLPLPDPLFPGVPDAARFDALCAWLARWFNVLPLDIAVQRLLSGSLPARAAAITFDDGYADNHDVALPILLRHGLKATFFIATGFLDGGRMWNDTVVESLRRCPKAALDLASLRLAGIDRLDVGDWAGKRMAVHRLLAAIKYLPPQERSRIVEQIAARSGAALPGELMMRSEQVRALHAKGMQVGAHTQTHPILAGLPRDAARREMMDSKHTLEALLREPVRAFAYPNGKPDVDYDTDSVRLARELGFEVAVSTAWGSATRHADPLQVPRFTPWDRSRLGFGLRLARNLRSEGRLARSGPAAAMPALGADPVP